MRTVNLNAITLILISLVLVSYQNCSKNNFTEKGSADLESTSNINVNGSNIINSDVGTKNTDIGELNLNQKIVATIYSETDLLSGKETCIPGSDSTAQKMGYFDFGNYSSCNEKNVPVCKNGSKKVVLSQASINFLDASSKNVSKVKYHTACLLEDKSEGFQFVATIFSETDLKSNKNNCITGSNPLAESKGYWDLGNYSYCDINGVPSCTNGSFKLVLAQEKIPGTNTLKLHTVCAINSAVKKTRIVSSIYSENKLNQDTCIYPNDPIAAKAGYFDVGGYAYCDKGIPMCGKGAKKIVSSMKAEGDKMIYHTNCILPQEATGSRVVATIFSQTVDGINSCVLANNEAAKNLGYFDENEYGFCDSNGTPQCAKGSKKVVMSKTQVSDKVYKYHTVCMLL